MALVLAFWEAEISIETSIQLPLVTNSDQVKAAQDKSMCRCKIIFPQFYPLSLPSNGIQTDPDRR